MLGAIFTSELYLHNIIEFGNIHSFCVELLSNFSDFIFGHLMER